MKFIDTFLKSVPLTGIVISYSAYFLGMKFPDWDFKLKLKHRNILTHSPLILVGFLYLYGKNKNDNFRFFLMGFSVALALHFIFDLYPKGWGGGALIKIPFVNISCPPNVSKNILILSIVITSVVAFGYTKKVMELYYLLILGVLTILKDTVKEKKLFRPLLLFIILGVIIGCFKYEELLLIFKNYIFIISKKVKI